MSAPAPLQQSQPTHDAATSASAQQPADAHAQREPQPQAHAPQQHAQQPTWQGQPQPGYAYPAPQPARPMSGLAVATFVLGLLGFAILPVILGHIALATIRRTGQGGAAFAVVGLVLGYLAIAGWVLLALLVGAGFVVFGG